ncbi:cupin domain-containing protein [Myxosarcina sp. GI1]|uniref:cupin domain-containing protein n=1 Tax=Myxosarcina sp. GI1 TaxID=1541065 RepID=UPI00056702A3|nr:cupin domain-containing protein [Myxosarcina sp. GI1]
MLIDPKLVPEHSSTNYPEPFKHLVAGRIRQRIGNAAGLTNFGVNIVKLQPGSRSALGHWHLRQDEFIYVIEGEITLVTNSGEHILTAGDMAGFPAGEADGHHLINRSNYIVTYLEIGDRTAGDEVTYPDDDLAAKRTSEGDVFTRKDGSLY